MSDESRSADSSQREGASFQCSEPAGIAGVPAVFETAARVSFGILIALIPFRARLVLRPIPIGSLYSDFTDWILFASDVFGLLTLLFWAGALVAERRKPEPGPWFLTWPLAGILVVGLISSFGSAAPALSWYHAARLAGLFALYLFIVNEVRALADLTLPIAALVSIQSVVAVAQYLSQQSIGLLFLDELALDPSAPGISIVWAPGSLALRSYGLTDHPNILGGCLALGLLFLIPAYLEVRPARRTPLLGVILIGLIALLFSFSRAAWLALAAGGLILAVWLLAQDRDGFRPLFALGMTSVLVLLPFSLAAAPYLGSRFGIGTEVRITDPDFRSPEHRSLDERSQLAEAANRMFVENPITGVGLGAFSVALQERLADFEYDYQPVHFVLLLAAVETGLLGALFYFLAVALPWVALWLARSKRSFGPGLAAASAALAGVTVIGLFDYYPWFLAPGRLWHWVIWGVWGAFYVNRPRNHE